MQRATKSITGTWTRDWLITAVLFVWLYQLLSPLGQAGGIPSMSLFYVFVAFLLVVDLLIPWRFVSIVLKVVSVFAFMHHFYFTEKIWNPDWIMNVFFAAAHAVGMVMEKRFMEVPEIPQTFFFLLFLWLTVSVYRNAMQSRIWLFILMFVGEVVIGVIDTFFPPDASGYVVRYFLAGFILLALSQLPELEKWARIPERMRGWPAKWILWTLVITVSAVGTGIAAPKYPPAWPDPVSFLQGKAARNGLTGVKKIGYGTDDNNLGGPYVMDNTVAFTVITNQPGYYRGESKIAYTGKGWLGDGQTIQGVPYGTASQPQFSVKNFQNMFALLSEVKSKKVEQQFQIENGQYNVLFGQYQSDNFRAGDESGSKARAQFQNFDPETWSWGAQLGKGNTYTAVSSVPYYDIEAVQAREKQATNRAGFDLNKIIQVYLQLPASLPARVGRLAQDITAGKASSYDKAKAIEQYLRNNYRYEIENVPLPGPDQDFVDQFLFDSKQGYCDHFSSAMVVLARSAGLPARWVKGFTEGEQDSSFTSDNDNKKYVIRNKNAHSWAEVYIPGTGWLPFEPTASFSQPLVQEVVPVTTPNTDNTATKERKDQEQNQDNVDTSVKVSYEIDWKTIGTIGLWVVGVLLVTGYILRRRLLVAFYLRRSIGSESDESSMIVQAVERLLKAMQRLGWRKENNLTVREFGGELSVGGYKGNEWILLARIFERARYGNKQAENREVGELRQLWGRIVRKIGRTKKR